MVYVKVVNERLLLLLFIIIFIIIIYYCYYYYYYFYYENCLLFSFCRNSLILKPRQSVKPWAFPRSSRWNQVRKPLIACRIYLAGCLKMLPPNGPFLPNILFFGQKSLK